jgi:hypothetical protein
MLTLRAKVHSLIRKFRSSFRPIIRKMKNPVNERLVEKIILTLASSLKIISVHLNL